MNIVWVAVLSLQLVTIAFIVIPSITIDTTLKLYASNDPTTIVNKYGTLSTWDKVGDTGTWLELEDATNGIAYLGNSSVCPLPSGIEKILNTTWTFHYYCLANVSGHVDLCANGTIVNANEEIVATLFTEEAVTVTNVAASNSTITGTIAVDTGFVLNRTDVEECGPYYLKIDWLIDNDGTKETVDLMLDTATDGSRTYISGIGVNYGLPSYLIYIEGLLFIIVLLGIVLYVVRASFKKGNE